MERPLGVNLSAFMLAAICAVEGVCALDILHTTMQPVTEGWFAGVGVLVMRAIGLLLAVLAVWSGVTAAGLLRLNFLAWISALLVGGCVACFGALFLVNGLTGRAGTGSLGIGLGLGCIAIGVSLMGYLGQSGTQEWFGEAHKRNQNALPDFAPTIVPGAPIPPPKAKAVQAAE